MKVVQYLQVDGQSFAFCMFFHCTASRALAPLSWYIWHFAIYLFQADLLKFLVKMSNCEKSITNCLFEVFMCYPFLRNL